MLGLDRARVVAACVTEDGLAQGFMGTFFGAGFIFLRCLIPSLRIETGEICGIELRQLGKIKRLDGIHHVIVHLFHRIGRDPLEMGLALF